MSGDCSKNRENRNAYRLLVGRRPIGRPRHRWVDNIKVLVDLSVIGWDGMDWICLAQDREK
jgi:hypothetical protein